MLYYEITSDDGTTAYMESAWPITIGGKETRRIEEDEYRAHTEQMHADSEAQDLTLAVESNKIEVDPLVRLAALEDEIQQLKTKLETP